MKIEAKRFAHRLTKYKISAKEKSREYLHIWTLNNRMHSRTSYSDRETWIGAVLERKIKNGILFLSRLRRLCDTQVETLGKELDIVGFKGKELDQEIKIIHSMCKRRCPRTESWGQPIIKSQEKEESPAKENKKD